MTALWVAKRVAKGVAWLDANRPGWPHLVNLVTFDINSPCACVLGQTTPSDRDVSGYHVVLGEISSDEWAADRWAQDHGFDAIGALDFADYDALQAEWTRVITGRLAAAEGTGDPSDGTP